MDVAAGSAVRIGTQRLAALDLSGAWALREFLHRARGAGTDVTFRGAPPDQLRLLDETLAAADATTSPTASPVLTEQAVLTAIGRNAVRAGADLIDGLGFVGRASVSFLRSLTSLKRLRPISVARHVYDTGLTAVPIVALIGFLISVIIAYMSAQQLRGLGADIYVVDLVAIGVLRELGVLLTSIIVAGRSGSAYAAELGSMKLNEEVDALTATGVDPFEVLVVPRLLGLTIALPLLTIIADLVGLAGGALLCRYLLDMPLTQYVVPRELRHLAQHLLGGPHESAGVRSADRTRRLLPRHAGARLGARARAAGDRGGGAGHFLRHPRRCAVRGAVHGNGHLMQPLLEVQGLVNRFGPQLVHDGLDMQVVRGRSLRHRRRIRRRQVGAAAHDPRPAAAAGRRGAHRRQRYHAA